MPNIRLAKPGEAICQMILDETGDLCEEPAEVIEENGYVTAFCREHWDEFLSPGERSVDELRKETTL